MDFFIELHRDSSDQALLVNTSHIAFIEEGAGESVTDIVFLSTGEDEVCVTVKESYDMVKSMIRGSGQIQQPKPSGGAKF